MLTNCIIYIILILFLCGNNVQLQQISIPPIPCPDYFQYLFDGTQYIGRIAIPTVANNIELVVYFNQRNPLQTNYYGRISIESRQPIIYRVEFPNPNEVPKLTRITVNGEDICIGNEYPSPNTRLFLSHKLQTSNQITAFSQPQPSFQQFQLADPNNDGLQNLLSNALQDQQFQTLQPRPAPAPAPRPSPQRTQFEFPNSRSVSFAQQPATATGQCGEENNISAFIFGGTEIQRGQFPWLTAIYVKSSGLRFLCGGSLVAARTVLTAGHCFKLDNLSANRVVVNLGRHNLDDYSEQGSVTREIQNLIIHPEYNSNAFPDADLAILQLQQPVQFTLNIRPICLWAGSSDSNLLVGQSGVIAGWGADETGRTFTPTPRKVNTNIVSDSECLRSSQAYSAVTSARTFCAGKRDGSGPCMGDSGGGLMINSNNRWYLRGIVSAGLTKQQKCDLNEFVVFCDVAKHLQWIQSNTIS